MNSRQLIEEVTASDVAKAARETEKNPTDKQKESGSYKMGKIDVQGLKISIENAKGGYRSGTDKNGKEWKVKIPAHYGYVRGTVGKDKDHVDVWIGPYPESPLVWVINQQRIESGAFDEHKCMIGFKTKEDALRTYDEAYQGGLGKKLRQSVTATSIEGFKDWLKNGSQNKPFVYESAKDLVESDALNYEEWTYEDFVEELQSRGVPAVYNPSKVLVEAAPKSSQHVVLRIGNGAWGNKRYTVDPPDTPFATPEAAVEEFVRQFRS